MTQIILDNLDPGVVAKLQALAQKHGRSLDAELKAILEQLIQSEAMQKAAARAETRKRLAQARQRHAGQTFSDSAELLREDRQR
jgi:plasmid stability protein